jgi:hypothetical protein
MQGDAIMKTISLIVLCGLSALSLTAGTAMSQDRLTGKLSLSALGGACPATLALADQAVPVDFVMPDTGGQAHPPVQNRFRFNYLAPAQVAHSVTITGQIADYGVKGCTVAFKGEAVTLN